MSNDLSEATGPVEPPSLVDPGDRALGAAGRVGPLGFGCWRFTHDDPGRAAEVLEAALDAGMNLVDTADVYGLDWGGSGFGANESALGAVLAARPELRDRMVLATKGGIVPGVPYDSGPQALRGACDASRRRLGTDVIDLYQVHRPDLLTHPEEVAGALAGLVAAGWVRAVGISNHTPDQYDAIRAFVPELVAVQPELSVVHLDPIRDGTLDRCMRDGVTPLAWSPLAGGRVITGEGLRPDLIAVLDELAEREGVDRAAVAMAFVLALPSRPVVLVGSQSVERLGNARQALSVRLDRADWYRILQASEGAPLP